MHAFGRVRVQFRAGDCGQNLGGGGVNERFALPRRQTMAGFAAVAGPIGPLETLQRRDELRFSVVPSRRDAATATATATATASVRLDNGLGRGIGSVREQCSSPVLTLDLPNRDRVCDAARGLYCASVPGAVAGQGNRTANIDAASGAVRLAMRSGPSRVRWPSRPMGRRCTWRWTAVVNCCAWPCPA